MKEIAAALAVIGFIVAALWFRVWQCGQLFPDANLLACMIR
jgi:hypothetical protein